MQEMRCKCDKKTLNQSLETKCVYTKFKQRNLKSCKPARNNPVRPGNSGVQQTGEVPAPRYSRLRSKLSQRTPNNFM
jgi:hypothetical protein